MSGTKEGAKNTANYMKTTYGADYYARIGAMGGKASKTGGFYANRELASRAGKIGGQRSRKPKDAR